MPNFVRTAENRSENYISDSYVKKRNCHSGDFYKTLFFLFDNCRK